MRIFVTGGTGFIGRHLLDKFECHDLLCLTRSPSQTLNRERVRWINADLHDFSRVSFELKEFEPDVAIHLAWQGLPDYSDAVCDANIQISLSFLRALANTNVKRIVVAGSCFEYGSLAGEMFETSKVEANSRFAEAKLHIFDEFNHVSKTKNIELVWSRIFYSFGPGQRSSSLIPTTCRALFAGEIPNIKVPGASHDFVFIDDVATALFRLTISDSVSGIFNIGSGRTYSVAELVNMIARNCNLDFRINNGEVSQGTWASLLKIKRYTGWEPKYTLQQGVAETLKALKKNSDK